MIALPHAVREFLTPDAFAEAFSVSRETVERLKTYESLLQQWQKTINLVAPSTLNQVWHRHFADSAQLVRLAPPAPKTWVDLGSGGGFPGLAVAILLAATQNTEKTKFTLIESDSRKAAFLREVARAVAVPVDILPVRIEAAATRASVRGAAVISARALSPLTRLFAQAAPFMTAGSVGLFPKGREVSRELQAAENEWIFDCELVPSLTDTEAKIAVIRNLSPKSPA